MMRVVFTLILALLGAWFTPVQAAPATCWPSDIGGAGGKATTAVFNTRGPAAGWHCPDGSDPLYAVRWGDVKDGLADALGKAQAAFLAGSAADKQAAAAALVQFAKFSTADVFDVWAPLATWKPIVAEGGTVIGIPATGVVLRYGAGDRWLIRPVYAVSIECTNAGMGADPAVGATKGCELAQFVGQPIPVAAPVYTHHVKPNGTAADRPVYGLTGTALTLAKGRAAVGQPCDLTRPTKASGGDLYAEFGPAFARGVVALCASP